MLLQWWIFGILYVASNLDNLSDNLKGQMTSSYPIRPSFKYIVQLFAKISRKVYETSLNAQRICSDFYIYPSLWDRPQMILYATHWQGQQLCVGCYARREVSSTIKQDTIIATMVFGTGLTRSDHLQLINQLKDSGAGDRDQWRKSPNFSPQHLHKNNVVSHACNLSTGTAETKGWLIFSLGEMVNSGLSERLVLNNKVVKERQHLVFTTDLHKYVPTWVPTCTMF